MVAPGRLQSKSGLLYPYPLSPFTIKSAPCSVALNLRQDTLYPPAEFHTGVLQPFHYLENHHEPYYHR